MNDDEILLNKQFCQAANAVAQFYTSSRHLRRKAYNDGVHAAMVRIEEVLRQHKSSNHNVVSIDYLLNMIGVIGPELIKEEKKVPQNTINDEQPKPPQPITQQTFPNNEARSNNNGTFWEQPNNTLERPPETNHESTFQVQPSQMPFSFGDTGNTNTNGEFVPPFPFTNESLFNFVPQTPTTPTQNTPRVARRRRTSHHHLQENHPPHNQQPYASHKRSADTFMNDDIMFSTGMSLLELDGTAPDSKRSRLVL
jgi:hypothetical protein